MHDPTAEELQIHTEHGRLFAKRWRAATATQIGRAPIVLFHDSLGCVELWRDFPQRLAAAAGRGVVAYDRLGFGRSDPHPGKLGRGFIEAEADGGFRVLSEQLEIDRFIAFGHSVGGGMAVACAARHGDACRALVTESAQAFVEDRTVHGLRAARTAFAEPGQFDRLRRYHGDKAAWVLSAWIDTWLAVDFADWNLDATARQVRCPTLAIHGDQDEYGSVLHPQRIAELTAGPAALRILDGCGHVPHKERPETVLAEAVTWLRDVGD
ncbi:alpha/beta fold hydrolase [Tahibacter caeni]|uniref:alpha/beta fold hydrolase n=1 Tax=Tahibacter caeni TaxID=1453545 RepID=UPI0021494CD8|nr:alpha/beta hydrolase [Tahibacter caeni]